MGNGSEALGRVSSREEIRSGYLMNEVRPPSPRFLKNSSIASHSPLDENLFLLSEANISWEVSISGAEKMYLKMATVPAI